MHMHYSLLFHNRTLATRTFKMAAIFQDGRHFRYAIIGVNAAGVAGVATPPIFDQGHREFPFREFPGTPLS